jgi:hypothetical protein
MYCLEIKKIKMAHCRNISNKPIVEWGNIDTRNEVYMRAGFTI